MLGYLGPPRVAIFGFQPVHLSLYQEKHSSRVSQQVFQIGNLFHHLGILLKHLTPLQVGQAAQLHFQNRLRLRLGQAEAVHEVLAGYLGGLGLPNGGNYPVNVIQSDFQSFQYVGSRFGLFQFKPGAPGDNLVAKVNIKLQRFFQADYPGLPADQRQHVGEESRLHGGIFIQVVQHLLRMGLFPQLDDNPHTLAVRLVTQVTDTHDFLILDQLGHRLHQGGLIRLIRQLGNHYLVAAGPVVTFDAGLGSNHYLTVPGSVGIIYPFPPQDDTRRGEVGSLDKLEKVINRRLGIIDEKGNGVTHLTEVMRRNIGRHPHGNPGTAVEQQVGQAGGQDFGLF